MTRASLSAYRRGAFVSVLGLVPGLLIGSALLSTPAARADQADDTYSPQRTYKAGDIDRYNIELHTVVSNPQIGDNVDTTIKMLMKETTKSVTAEGNGVVYVEFETGSAKFGDNELDISSYLPTSTQTRSKTSVLIDDKSDGDTAGPAALVSGLTKQIFGTQQSFYPSKPSKIGDSWTIDTKSGKPDGPTTTMKGTATLTGTEMINGMKTLVVKSVIDTNVKGLPKAKADDAGIGDLPSEITAHYEAVGNVDVATGRIVKTVGSLKISGGPIFKNKLDIKIALATGADAPAAAPAAPAAPAK